MPTGQTIRVRVVSLNVEFAARATAERVAEALLPLRPDILGLCEVPDGDWSAQVGRRLGLEHVHVGRVSSANHKDKYKSILCRAPLENRDENILEGRGWNPASLVWAETLVAAGVRVGIGSLHICANPPDVDGVLRQRGHSHSLREYLQTRRVERLVIMGDFNNCLGDPAMEPLSDAGLRNTWQDLDIDVHRDFTYSAVSDERLGVIDHILYKSTPGARATAGGIVELESPLADHKPIWADIEFQRNEVTVHHLFGECGLSDVRFSKL